jgi:hypothetical protein
VPMDVSVMDIMRGPAPPPKRDSGAE